MLSISSRLSTPSVGRTGPAGENTLPSRRDLDDFNAGSLRRQRPSPPSIAPSPPSEKNAFTNFVHEPCLEARINLLVEPLLNPRLLQPAVFGVELHRAHAQLRNAAARDPLMHPALQVVNEIVALNGTTNDFRYALHLV